ncbi:MAG: zinc-ribbon domain-containing protein [Planctomycetes bacterium]|nr:zinc-ribbon domain-containing protein [Planctomycetota bacterium]
MIPVPIGIDDRIRTTGKGAFHCPNCGPNREYLRKRRAQYFNIFFIPVFPINEWPERVTCKNCCSQFDKSVFFYNPELERQEREQRPDRIKLVMILMLIRGDHISEAAMRKIEEVFEAEGGETLSREDLEQDIAATRELEMDPLIDLIQIAQKLQPKGASTVLRHAFHAASSDGTLNEADRDFLEELREALGVSEVAFHRITAKPN